MRLLVLIGIATVAVVGAASCADAGPPSIKACAGKHRATVNTAAAMSRAPLLTVVQRSGNTPAVLARLDPLSLEPVSREVEVSEYHDAWSVSPDGSQLAVARGGQGIGIEIIDLKTMKLSQQIETGIAAEALGWLRPHRLVAALQRGGTVLIDPRTGTIRRRWPAFSFPDAAARTSDALVMLSPPFRTSTPSMPLMRVAGSPRLAVVDDKGRLRSVTLTRVRLRVRAENGIDYADRAGLAVDPVHARAYVFAADAPVAAVDLHTLTVSYPFELASPGNQEGDVALAKDRRALWLGNGRLAVLGRDLVARNGKLAAIPAGVTVLETANWSACVLDRSAAGAVVGANHLLVYGSRLPARSREIRLGLHAYSPDMNEVFHRFDDEQVWDVALASDRAYVFTRDALFVVDAGSGKVMGRIDHPPVILDPISIHR